MGTLCGGVGLVGGRRVARGAPVKQCRMSADASLAAHKVTRLNVSLSTADPCFARGGPVWGRVTAWLLEHLVGYDAVVLNELFAIYRCPRPAPSVAGQPSSPRLMD